ncbi:sigma-54 interaction domain-containing protein [Zhaonella formicivorans]|uniref:sigma-54 interaction domain-containing protein n=1 Tax=Zhaonella formicivorans TaxID=2528593 RepID=UPI001D10974A|nr:sigma 54-interacting transcriptional regulator [Zhaonella formicivorans]
MSELKEIQGYVQDIAEAISAVLDMGVEIIDRDLLRVAGTGESKVKVGTKMAMGHICRHAITCRQPFVLIDPGKNQLCEVCVLFGQCNIIQAGLFMPILLEGASEGLINLVAFTGEQKARLVEKQSTYLEYVAKMAELLSSKIAENRSTKKLKITSDFLKTIINSIDLGIIGVDAQGHITHINPAATDILGLGSASLNGTNINYLLPQSPLSKILVNQKVDEEQVVTYQIGTKQATVLSYCYPVVTDGVLTGAVEAFYRLADVQKTLERWADAEYQSTLSEIVGESEPIKKLKAEVLQIAQGNSTVLIEGESGTGKELFARAIHAASPRWNKPFKIINCSAIPDTLLESELFGYEEGAFTGAKRGGKIGKFELADGGTVFLDELGELPLYLQAKLLRVLQNRTVERVGGNKEIKVDVRIIAATNRDMEKMVADGEFRADLYYRLNVIPLKIPPLRERKEDISVLASYFIDKFNKILHKAIRTIHPEALAILKNYNWPGNVRELENVIEYACNFEQGRVIMPASLPARILVNTQQVLHDRNLQLKKNLREVEKILITKAVAMYGGNLKEKEKIALELGISVPSLYRKLKELNIKIDNCC